MTSGGVAMLDWSSMRFGATSTVSGKSCRNRPRVSASLEHMLLISPASSPTLPILARRAVPRAITHALPSLLMVPSGPSDICFVRAPPSALASSVISNT